MADSFSPPKLPATPNISGLPMPPSGMHPSSPAPTVVISTNGLPPVGPPTGQPAANIHGSPLPPGIRGLVGRLLHRGGYDVLESVR